MAGRKRRGNKSRMAKYGRYSPANAKDIKAKKQKRLEDLQTISKKQRIEAIDKCCNKFHLGIVGLKKRFGTLNIRRLNSLLDDSYLRRSWYKDRVRLTEEKDKVKAMIQNDTSNSKVHSKEKTGKRSEESKTAEVHK